MHPASMDAAAGQRRLVPATYVTLPVHAGVMMTGDLAIDPRLPASTCLLRSGGEQVLMDTVAALRARGPAYAEDADSLAESLPYAVRHDQATEPMWCECCGTPVIGVPESLTVLPRRWQRGIWEPDTWRRHTPRRCERMRGPAGRQSCQPSGRSPREAGLSRGAGHPGS